MILIKADKTENTYELEKLDDIYRHKAEILECIKGLE